MKGSKPKSILIFFSSPNNVASNSHVANFIRLGRVRPIIFPYIFPSFSIGRNSFAPKNILFMRN